MACISGSVINSGAASKVSVKVATTQPIPPYNSTSTHLYANSNGELVVDGVTLVKGDLVLVKDETLLKSPNNGPYVVQQEGNISKKWILKRWRDTFMNSDVRNGSFRYVREGKVNKDSEFILKIDNSVPFLIGTSTPNYTRRMQGVNKRLNWTRKWSGTSMYSVNDGCTYGGSTYICITANLNKLPNDATYWDLLAGRGENQGNVTSVCILKDIKGNGVNGGTFNEGTWEVRDLNVLQGNMGSHCTLSSNTFTLQPGNYSIKAYVPAHRVQDHQARLYNVSTSNFEVYGSNAYSKAKDKTCQDSIVLWKGLVESETKYQIQHRCGKRQSTNGFGIASGFGQQETYTQVYIERENFTN